MLHWKDNFYLSCQFKTDVEEHFSLQSFATAGFTQIIIVFAINLKAWSVRHVKLQNLAPCSFVNL